MSNVRLYVNHKPVQLISSVVERNGTRAIDTGEFVISRKTKVEKGDTFQYLQDVISPINLVGLWNMEKTVRDESGFDNDGDETTSGKHEGSFNKGADGYYYKNSNSGRCIKVAHDSHLDLSQQFDIIVLAKIGTYPYTNRGFLWGKGDATNGIELKAKDSASSSAAFYLELTVNVGGTTTTITGSVDMNYNNVDPMFDSGNMNRYRYIRVKRDENNLISLIVDKTVAGTATVSGDISPNSSAKPLYLAGDKSGTNILEDSNYLALARFYSGAYLSDDQYDTLLSSRRPTEVMKFGGTVWKIDEKSTYTKCYCKGLADKLHNIEVNKSLLTGITWTTNDTDIIKNEYFNKRGYEILEDLFKAYNLGIEFTTENTGNINETYDHYHAIGTLFSSVYLLTLNGGTDESFHISPRGTLLMEDDDNDHTKILFKQGAKSRIHNFGYDDSNVITELTLISGNSIVDGTKSLTAGSFSTTLTSGEGYPQTSNHIVGKPLEISITDPNGLVLIRKGAGGDLWDRVTGVAGAGEFKLVYHDPANTARSLIYLGTSPFYNSPAKYEIRWKYENKYDTANYTKYYTARGANYASLGAYSKTLNIPQFMGQESLSNLAIRMFAKLGGVERRVTVTIPTLVNHIRENYLVQLEDPAHGVGTEGSPISLSVKSMKFYYPEGKTIINCGEHQLDSFDLDKSFGEAISSAKSVLINTP